MVKITLYILGALGFVLSIAYFRYFWFVLPTIGDGPWMYWWHRSVVANSLRLSCCFFPVLIVLTCVVISRERSLTRILINAVLLGLLLLAGNGIACAATLPFALEQHRFYGSVQTPDHVYYLDSGSKPGIGGNNPFLLVLWECDPQGWVCHIVHRERRMLVNEDYTADEATAELILVPEDGSLNLIFNGEMVYHHIPE